MIDPTMAPLADALLATIRNAEQFNSRKWDTQKLNLSTGRGDRLHSSVLRLPKHGGGGFRVTWRWLEAGNQWPWPAGIGRLSPDLSHWLRFRPGCHDAFMATFYEKDARRTA